MQRILLVSFRAPGKVKDASFPLRKKGRIMDVHDGISKVGQYQIVVLNRGLVDGVQPGHVLSVWQTGGEIVDRYAKTGFKSAIFNRKVQLPEQVAGKLLVFRSLEQISYGLIMSATSEISALDIVRNPL